MKKYHIFTVVALLLLTFSYTVPILGFHGTIDKIKNQQVEDIPSYSYKIWDFYSRFQYVSPFIARGADPTSLKSMIETRSEIGVASMPVWRVALEAPNYPKASFPDGIPVFFHMDGYSGDVEEMNTINHYIGMYPMEHGGQLERMLVPYFFIIMTMMMVWFLFAKHKHSWILMAIPMALPIGFLIDYAGWLYWYGHNMQDWGAFTIKPFMPTVFGQGQVAQFTTHSYPTTGYYVLVIASILSILAVFSKLKESKQVKE